MATQPEEDKNISIQMCEALGLDPGTIKGFDLHVHASEAVTVTVENFISPLQMKKLTKIIQKYNVKIDKEI